MDQKSADLEARTQELATRAQEIVANAPPPAAVNNAGTNSESNEVEMNKRIDDIVEKMGKKFSRDEVDNFVKLGKKVAAKPVLEMLVATLAEFLSATQLKPLEKKIRKTFPYNYCIPAQLTFNELPGYRLNIQLSKVPRDYRTDISIPDERYAPEVFGQYEFLRKTAVAYWVEWTRAYPDLYRKVVNALKDVDMSEPHVDDANPTTMYFSAETKSRIGIFCYYTDEAGRPLIKKAKAAPPLDSLAESAAEN